MTKIKILLLTIFCVFILSACEAPVTPVNRCDIKIMAETVAYFRPSTEADRFTLLKPGDNLNILGRTADNWYAFEPEVLQGGYAGIFRNRWVQANPSLNISPTCSNLAVIFTKVPKAGVCYAIALSTTLVRQLPEPSSAVIYTLSRGDYAAGKEKNGIWVKVDLSAGSLTGVNQVGWISQETISLDGCGSLPIITP